MRFLRIYLDSSGRVVKKLCDRLANVIYSRETKSRMFNIYKEENVSFLKSLFERPDKQLQYRELVQELKDAFVLVRAIPCKE